MRLVPATLLGHRKETCVGLGLVIQYPHDGGAYVTNASCLVRLTLASSNYSTSLYSGIENGGRLRAIGQLIR